MKQGPASDLLHVSQEGNPNGQSPILNHRNALGRIGVGISSFRFRAFGLWPRSFGLSRVNSLIGLALAPTLKSTKTTVKMLIRRSRHRIPPEP